MRLGYADRWKVRCTRGVPEGKSYLAPCTFAVTSKHARTPVLPSWPRCTNCIHHHVRLWASCEVSHRPRVDSHCEPVPFQHLPQPLRTPVDWVRLNHHLLDSRPGLCADALEHAELRPFDVHLQRLIVDAEVRSLMSVVGNGPKRHDGAEPAAHTLRRSMEQSASPFSQSTSCIGQGGKWVTMQDYALHQQGHLTPPMRTERVRRATGDSCAPSQKLSATEELCRARFSAGCSVELPGILQRCGASRSLVSWIDGTDGTCSRSRVIAGAAGGRHTHSPGVHRQQSLSGLRRTGAVTPLGFRGLHQRSPYSQDLRPVSCQRAQIALQSRECRRPRFNGLQRRLCEP